MPNDFDDAAMSEAALADWNRPEEDAAWAHLQDATKPALTPMLQRAIEAAKALPEEDQDALAAEILEWIEDEHRWSESFARTHDALAEFAREALPWRQRWGFRTGYLGRRDSTHPRPLTVLRLKGGTLGWQNSRGGARPNCSN